MTQLLRAGICASLVSLSGILLPGCRTVRPASVPAPPQNAALPLSAASAGTPPVADVPVANMPAANSAAAGPAADIQQVAHRQPADAARRPPAPEEIVVPQVSDGLFAGQAELSLQQLTDIVTQQNASLQAMTFAWRAAQQRYPQAIALDDPTFMAMTAPASFSSNTTQSAYVLGGAQKLPWFGKRETRGAAAQADASAMFHDVRDARLQLEQSTRMAFYEYYLVARELDLNRQNLELTQEFRDTAQAKYENNQVTQQDVLQADVESATTERRLLELNRMYRIAAARINTLLRRNPDEFLPAPPRN